MQILGYYNAVDNIASIGTQHGIVCFPPIVYLTLLTKIVLSSTVGLYFTCDSFVFDGDMNIICLT